jgi:hypothetical protein
LLGCLGAARRDRRQTMKKIMPSVEAPRNSLHLFERLTEALDIGLALRGSERRLLYSSPTLARLARPWGSVAAWWDTMLPALPATLRRMETTLDPAAAAKLCEAAILDPDGKPHRFRLVCGAAPPEHHAAGILLALEVDRTNGALVAERARRSDDEAPPIQVAVDADIVDLIPAFLAERRGDAATIEDLLAQENFVALHHLGHRLWGCGAPYGFAEISEIGSCLAWASESRRHDTVRALASRLRDYLTRVLVDGVPTTTA